MISHAYRCIFVEVPKTGSTSIRAILGAPAHPHLNVWQIKQEMESFWTRYGGRLNRYLAAFYLLRSRRRRREVGSAQFASYYKFGFVRNPWDRMVSLYERREGLQLRDRMSFPDFIDWAEYSSSTCLNCVPHRYQLDWFVDPNGAVVVDTIGRFERLAEDWAAIAGRIGAPRELPRHNRNSARKPYTEYYDERTRQVVAERFRVDIERFGYTFGAP